MYIVLALIYFKALNLKSPGYQKFPMVVHNEMEYKLYGITVLDQFVTITFPTCKRAQLNSEIRYLDYILELVKISTINS